MNAVSEKEDRSALIAELRSLGTKGASELADRLEQEDWQTHKDTTYNGWKNYETWVTALWIDNDPGTYEISRRIAREAKANADPETVRIVVADALQTWAEESFVEPALKEPFGASLASDLLNAAFGQVSFLEIATNYLEELDEE